MGASLVFRDHIDNPSKPPFDKGGFAWSGLAFERLCMAHTQQIKAALGIAGVLSNVYSWCREADEMSDGAQIDLLIDRKDQVINLCEMKYSLSEYIIDAEYEQKLRNKKSTFKIQQIPERQYI